MAFHISGKVVALHLDNNTTNTYLCNQGGTTSPFLSKLACHILNLANKHVITPIPAYKPTHLNEETDYLLWGRLVPEWHLLPCIAEAVFQIWDLLKWNCLYPYISINVSINKPWKIHYI